MEEWNNKPPSSFPLAGSQHFAWLEADDEISYAFELVAEYMVRYLLMGY
jgi:hypothetical protein